MNTEHETMLEKMNRIEAKLDELLKRDKFDERVSSDMPDAGGADAE